MRLTLEDHHRQIMSGIAEIRRQYDAPSPDTASLGAARLRLSRASLARSRYVNGILIPKLLQDAAPPLRAQLEQMQREFHDQRSASSHHVTAWSSRTILADWNGYRAAAREIWAMMERRIGQERAVVGERIARMGL